MADMDAGLAVIMAAKDRQKPLNDAIERGDSEIQQFYRGSTVFVTGGSGFIGKQLIVKLFGACKIKKLYLLLRRKKGKSVKDRLPAILSDPIFEDLLRDQPSFVDNLVPVEGDVSEIGIGISDADRQNIIEEVEIILHGAATIAFEEPLRSATITNIRGTREMITLAKQCHKLRSFLYISTAYCQATISRIGREVLEQFGPCPVNPDIMIQLAESLKEDRLNAIKPGLIRDWPNTYTFTKALAEEMVRIRAGDLPICILRPTVVICSYRDACPGWVDLSSVYGPSGITLGTTMGVIHSLQSRQEIKIDFVPLDFVVNAALVAATTARELPLRIYQIGTSCRNPLSWGNLSYILNNVARKTIVSEKAMWYCIVVQSPHRWVFLLFKVLLQDTPAFIIDWLLILMKKPPSIKKIYSIINKMAMVLAFYTNNDWIFDDRNTLKLYQNLSETDKIIYQYNVEDINWTEMILLWCVGLRKYVVKDGLKNTKWGVQRQFYFKMITYFVLGIFVYLFLMLVYSLVRSFVF